MTKKLVILGAGGYGRTIADVARQLGVFASIAFLDDCKSGEAILGTCSDFLNYAGGDTVMYPAFGDNDARMLWMNRLKEAGVGIPTFIHPSAYVSPEARIGEGVVILPLAAVNTNAVIGMGCIVNAGAIVDHDTILEAGIHLCPGVVVKAENRIAAMTRLESGTVIPARQIPR